MFGVEDHSCINNIVMLEDVKLPPIDVEVSDPIKNRRMSNPEA